LTTSEKKKSFLKWIAIFNSKTEQEPSREKENTHFGCKPFKNRGLVKDLGNTYKGGGREEMSTFSGREKTIISTMRRRPVGGQSGVETDSFGEGTTNIMRRCRKLEHLKMISSKERKIHTLWGGGGGGGRLKLLGQGKPNTVHLIHSKDLSEDKLVN